ncbi:MAG: YifB family Mg chelatase-like AAA ATPase [Treponemataceae bacterium]|nr:MAG: YifB family Mg chelatase-like AAA ATPase [Treponemataceae bacterium]
MRIYSFSSFGYEGALVAVEVDLRRGIPAIDMVGLADGAVRESRERVRAAIRNSGYEFPNDRILISLSPADVKKEGAGFDLAIALAVLIAGQDDMSFSSAGNESSGVRDQPPILVMGELELTGKIRPVHGIHAAVSSAAESGITRCIVPAPNAAEAEMSGIAVCAAETLPAALQACFDSSKFTAPKECLFADGVFFPPVSAEMDIAVVKNQGTLARGLQIAAAGRHHVLALGPPGSGKTLALSRFPALLPYLTASEARPVSRIHSLAGEETAGQRGLIRVPPFRAPHQSTSLEGMTGGGKHCSPGEISLAHNGILFLDEILEFKQHVLQSLRVPLEAGTVTVSRAGRSSVFPARFVLLAAANPCPCGNFGAEGKICLCGPRQIEQYWKKLSGPLLDRIDIRIPVFPRLSAHGAKESRYAVQDASTESLREGIARAIRAQTKRQGKYNSALLPEDLDAACPLTDDARKTLEDAALLYGFSSRSVSSCKKTARTIADIAESGLIQREHIEEAVFFRKNEGGAFGLTD